MILLRTKCIEIDTEIKLNLTIGLQVIVDVERNLRRWQSIEIHS